MHTQYVAHQCSLGWLFASLESQGQHTVLADYRKTGFSGMVGSQPSSEGCNPYERQDGVKTPYMSENKDRSIQCQTSLKAPLRLAWLLSFPLVAAAVHQTKNMLWLTQRQFQLSQSTPVNTSNRLLKRAFGPVSLLCIPKLQAELPAQSALRGAFAC